MYFRCVDCQASTWIDELPARGRAAELACHSCGRRYPVHTPEHLAGSPAEQHDTALALSDSSGIDLPSAYSVLLGLMTLGEALEQHERKPAPPAPPPPRGTATRAARANRPLPAPPATPVGAAHRTAPPVRAGSPGRTRPPKAAVDYDPAFADAVTEGFMTAGQARARGSRDAFADRLVGRHGLPRTLALLVTDNKVTLTSALEQQREAAALRIRARRKRLAGRVLVAAVPVVIFSAVFLWGARTWSDLARLDREAAEALGGPGAAAPAEAPATAAETTPPPLPASVLMADDVGVTAVTGRDPASVLRAYCDADGNRGRLQPVELAPTVPPYAGARLGVFRDYDRLDRVFAIHIRRDRETGRWAAGDGSGPVAVTEIARVPGPHGSTPIAPR